MTIHVLAPRPGCPVASVAPNPPVRLAHSDSEWAALYPEIERLYVRERRKLKHVMQYMESEHDFKATVQMYKKRFTRWGFQKNTKRSAATTHPLEKTNGGCKRAAACKKASSPSGEMGMPASPKSGHRDDMALIFLTSVRTWSTAFFESVRFGDGVLSTDLRPPTAKKINFAFMLVIDLLQRGHGDLAGRMVRKAFLLVEDMLTLDGPAMVWNLLQMMHHMVTLRHVQLFYMLLDHLIALADGQMPKTHPLPAVLRSLRGLAASPATVADPWLLSRAISSLLERAWTLNAEILFNNLDLRLFNLYCRILWESCSICLPAAIIGAANQWLCQIEEQTQSVRAATVADLAEELPASTPVEEDIMIRRLLTPRMDASPPLDYGMLRASSIAELRHRWNAILANAPRFNGDTTILMRVLAGLAIGRLLEGSPVVAEPSGATESATARVPRIDARNLACAISSLIDLDTDGGGAPRAPLDAVERIRALVTLRGYAEGETDPQVVREMWLLQDALVAAGKYEEAQEVERDVCHRVEQYIQDIPANSA